MAERNIANGNAQSDDRTKEPQRGFGPPGRPGFGGGPRGGHMYMGPKEKAKNARGTLKRILMYIGKGRAALVLVFVMVCISSAAGLVGPYLIGKAVDTMTSFGVDFQRLLRIALAMTGLYAVGTLATFFQMYSMVSLGQRTVRIIRNDLFAKIQTLPLTYFDTKTHGELMSRLSNDVETVNTTLTQSITQLFSSLITVTGSFIMMLRLSPFLTLLSLLVIPLGIAITSGIAKKTRTYFSGQAKELGAMNGFIEETVSGERTVKAFRMEKRVIADFDEVNGRLTREGVRAQVFSGIIPPFMNLINNLSFVIVACAGGYLAVRGLITVGLIASFLSYSKQFGRPINEMANQFNMIQSAIACAERVFEVMDAAPEPADMQGSAVLSGVRGEVELSGVQFSYRPGVPVLKDISLKAEPGKSIAIVGPTGAGKTTIVNLLCRFYEIDKGSILVDGRNIASVTRESLRRSFGIVLQDTYLFSGTVRENIRYGRLDASDAEVEEAARIAEADVFIRRLPSGYETVLSDDAGNLSLGQRQLVTIARAILADPPILILDEATSNVDTRTELHIQKAMLSLMRGRTSFVIAHRLSTIRDAAEIIVIDQGTIIERGNHEKLMNEQGFYYKLYSSQWKREAEMRESVRLV